MNNRPMNIYKLKRYSLETHEDQYHGGAMEVDPEGEWVGYADVLEYIDYHVIQRLRDDLVEMQKHRDSWREYAYGSGKKPTDYLDGNKINRPVTALEWADEFIIEPEWFPNEGDRAFWRENRAALTGRSK